MPARLVQVFALPKNESSPAGPLHTIIEDFQGNIFYSDEINHSIVSLDSSGSIRWQLARRGSGPGEFQYPKGLAFGWICKAGQNLNCIAVCDSWNRRIQFITPDGSPIGAWLKAGEAFFGEPVDLRYISCRADSPSGFWIILDRQNHRLYAIAPDGSLLFQTGNCFPPTISRNWPVLATFIPKALRCDCLTGNFPPLDSFYYPERILGNSPRAIFLYQPASYRIAQLFFGYIIPLHLDADLRNEWISASDSTLTAWNRDSGRLLLFNGSGELKIDFPVSGRPIASNSTYDAFWLQKFEQLERWILSPGSELTSPEPIGIALPFFRASLGKIDNFDTAALRIAVDSLCQVCMEEVCAAEALLRATENEDYPESLVLAEKSLSPISQRRLSAQRAFEAAIQELGWDVFLSQLFRYYAPLAEQTLSRFLKRWDAILDPIRKQMTGVQNCIDSLYVRRLSAVADGRDQQPRMKLELAFELDLRELPRWLYLWSGIVEADSSELIPSVDIAGEGIFSPQFLFQTTYRPHRARSPLREVGCISVSSDLCSDSSRPLGSMKNSLPIESYRYVQMDIDSRRQKSAVQVATAISLGPGNQLLAVNPFSARISLIKLLPGVPESIAFSDGHEPPILLQAAVVSDGALSLSQTKSGLELRISSKGFCEFMAAESGHKILQLRQPFSIAASLSGNTWVVARAEHCIIKMTKSGGWEARFGHFGFECGGFFYPEYAAEFEDGSIAVAQNIWNRSIKLITPKGEEFGAMKLPYKTNGIAVMHGLLFVIEANSDLLHIYERS